MSRWLRNAKLYEDPYPELDILGRYFRKTVNDVTVKDMITQYIKTNKPEVKQKMIDRLWEALQQYNDPDDQSWAVMCLVTSNDKDLKEIGEQLEKYLEKNNKEI